MFPQVAYIGCGLINGSLARALTAAGLAERQVAYSRSEATRVRVRALGLSTKWSTPRRLQPPVPTS